MNVDTENSSFESGAEEGAKVVLIARKLLPNKELFCHPNRSFRLVRIDNRRAIFMIIFNALFTSTTLGVDTVSAKGQYSLIDKPVLSDNFHFIVLFLFFPFIGLLSDCYFGRYRILTASLYLWLLSIVFMALDVIILSRLPLLYYACTTALVLSWACFAACVLPFTIDQLVGASGEQLSFTIYWIVWACVIQLSISGIFSCFTSRLGYELHQSILFLVNSSSFVLAYVMIHCCDHILMTKPQLSNPTKLIIRVLNYARKHKFPERRSAFTYWEDECPSRIDLGKQKYGGPFTVEEVENVKTVFKLIPLVVCINGALFADKITMKKYFMYDIDSCEIKNPRIYYPLIKIVIMILWLPIYHFLIYPFFYNCVPSMLRRIGMGICLIASSQLFTSVMWFMFIDIFSVTDATVTNSESEPPPLNDWFVLCSYLVRDFSKVIVVIVSVWNFA